MHRFSASLYGLDALRELPTIKVQHQDVEKRLEATAQIPEALAVITEGE